MVVGLYLFIQYPQLVNSLGEISAERVALGSITIVLLAEACRRLVGWPLVIIAACFSFTRVSPISFPGDFYGRGWSVSRLATYLYLDANGILGQALQVGASIVLVFVIFGEVLYVVGGAEFLSDFSLALMGRFRGGQAKIAIVSSSLFGNISGSAVANVVVDGAFTIPMMKKAGYPPPVAAAVEAVASTGGQIMPPVMGAAAFLIAEYLQIPYAQVALAAFVPAVLYYVALFIQVDLLAARNGIHGLPRNELPRLVPVLKRSLSFVGPLAVLVVWMFFLNRRPEEAGLLAAAAALVIGILTPGVRLGWQEILRIFLNAGRGMLEIAAITGLAGVVIGVLQLTGLGFTLTLTLLNIGQSNALLLLVLTAIVSMVSRHGYADDGGVCIIGGIGGPRFVQTGDFTHCRPPVHLLLWNAEHDHAAGLFGQLCGRLHRQNRSRPNRLGRHATLRHRLCGAFSICFFTFVIADRSLVGSGAFCYHRYHRRDPAGCRVGGLSFSPGWSDQTNSVSLRRNGFADSDPSQRQVCGPNLGQQQYRASAGDLACISGVASAFVSRPRANDRRGC